MESQLSLFNETDTVVTVNDIRTEQQSSKKIAYDVGEKIGNARKDLAALRKAFEENQTATLLSEIEEFSTILAAEIINKNELFKGFTLENEKEKGVEPSVARAKQLLLQRVDHTPKIDSKESRHKFMKAAQYLLSILEPVKTMDELYSVLSEIATLLGRERNRGGYFEEQLVKVEEELNCLGKESDEWKALYQKGIQYKKSIKNTIHAKEIGLSILGEKFINFFRKNANWRSTLSNALKIDSWDELLTKKEKKKGTARKPGGITIGIRITSRFQNEWTIGR